MKERNKGRKKERKEVRTGRKKERKGGKKKGRPKEGMQHNTKKSVLRILEINIFQRSVKIILNRHLLEWPLIANPPRARA